ncbi:MULTISPECIES: DUF6788 family protein [Microvirga]|uniref:DUF6788 family protein n=1 Tax=Microvirga TaxID=186650 RepID=UPI00352FF95C
MDIQHLSSAALRKRRHKLAHGLPPIEQVLRGSLIETYKRYGHLNCYCITRTGSRSEAKSVHHSARRSPPKGLRSKLRLSASRAIDRHFPASYAARSTRLARSTQNSATTRRDWIDPRSPT